jgi:hypothetical protein
MAGIVIMAGTAITVGTVGTVIGADAPAYRPQNHRPCGASPVQWLSRHRDASGEVRLHRG